MIAALKRSAPARLLKRQHLRSQLGFDLSLAGFLMFASLALFTAFIVSARFEVLEQREVADNTSRLETWLESQKSLAQAKALDWAIWTESFDYIANGDRRFEVENLNIPSLVNLDVNAISYVRFDGRRNTTTYVDLEQEAADAEKAAVLKAYLDAPALRKMAQEMEKFQTFARIDDKLVVLSFAHVKMSDNSGVPLGFVVMAREIEPESIAQQMQQKAGYDFRLLAGDSTSEVLRKTINVGVSIKGFDGAPVATIRYELVRDLAAIGRNMLLVVGIGIALLVFIMICVLDWRLRTAVVAPLVVMKNHVRRIEKTKILSTLDEDDRRDEIGTLQKAFNSMAEQLMALRSELEAQSFELGKNQSAIGVMHNVRNGLSPVFTFLSRTDELLQNSSQNNIARALAEMGQDDLDDDRRKKLAAFLEAAVNQYDEKLDLCRTKASEAGMSLSSVLEAIEQVQDDDTAKPVVSDCAIDSILEAGLVTARHASGKQISITRSDNPANASVRANRVLLTQVIVNVLTNAAEAIAATGRGDGLIHVAQDVVDDPDGRMLELTIIDNGDGFEPGLAARLFERGYSTRTGKSGGLGLHWCANTLNAMGGSIHLESAGNGKGSTATIRLALGTEGAAAANNDLDMVA